MLTTMKSKFREKRDLFRENKFQIRNFESTVHFGVRYASDEQELESRTLKESSAQWLDFNSNIYKKACGKVLEIFEIKFECYKTCDEQLKKIMITVKGLFTKNFKIF